EYFKIRGYVDDNWTRLQKKVAEHGIRNGYLLAVAPNSSTSMIAGSTASIDPVFKPYYSEEKNDFRIPTTAPELTPETYLIYRRLAYLADERWSVKLNAVCQRHIDQSISFNFYVPRTIRASVLLELHLQAWETGLKTAYYVISTSNDIEE